MPRFLASIAIPAYDEGRRLPPFLAELVELGLAHEDRPVELVVVDDGSAPAHRAAHRAAVEAAAVRLAAAGSRHQVRLVACERNGGKGAAIRRGWREADAEAPWLGFLDADGAVPAAEVWRVVGRLGEDVDLVAGSRILMAGRRVRRSTYRHLQGRVFATLTEWTFRTGFYDTQCGFKLARGALLRPDLPLLQERGWLLDVELIALVQARGGVAREEPIDWADPGGSKVRFGIDALRMFLGLRRIRRGLAARLAAAPRPALPARAGALPAPARVTR